MKAISNFEVKKVIDKGSAIDELKISLSKLFIENSQEYSVLGFDIYKYSKYKTLEQSLIPLVFKQLYKYTINHCMKYEKYIFQQYANEKEFLDRLIDTGDGGFQLFDNPIEAIIFAFYFQANLKRFNSYGTHKELREIIGEITLRYALTTDSLFKFENNYYGPAIINNARIMSKDKLNRFLIDDSTIKWLDRKIKGIENLQTLFTEDFKEIEHFLRYKIDDIEDSLIFSEAGQHRNILNSDILRIGEIEAKGDHFSVYSFHCQVSLYSIEEKGFNRYTITVGNLNSTGLDNNQEK